MLPTVDIAENYRPSAQHETKKMTIKDLLEKGAGKINLFKSMYRLIYMSYSSL